MTGQAIPALLDRLELLLAAPLDEANGEALAGWNEAFRQSLAQAEGPLEPGIQARIQALGHTLNRRMALIRDAQAERKRELAKVATGRRALSAYQTRP